MRKTAGNNRRCHLKTQKKSNPQIAKNPIPMSDTIELICQQLFDQYTPVNLNIRLPSNVSHVEILDGETKSAVDLHLSMGCPRCNAQRRELSEGIDFLLQAVPDDGIGEEQRAAIVANAQGKSSPRKRARSAISNEPVVLQRTSTTVGNQSSWIADILPYLVSLAVGVLIMTVHLSALNLLSMQNG